MSASTTERESLVLLSDAQKELARTIESLAGTTVGIREHYMGHTLGLANKALDAFVELRRIDRVPASKLLIRPAIEAVIRACAVQKQPDLIFRIAFTEFEEDNKWFSGTNPGLSLAAHEKNWDDFKADFATTYPNSPQVERKISVWDLAQAADLGFTYDSFYRTYCQYTHGALRASTGSLDVITATDEQTLTLFCLKAIDALVLIGGTSPNLPALLKHLPPLLASSTSQP
jgi:hypothetical protein